MTLAFTFPIKDAWVVVADRKKITKLNDVFDNNGLPKKITIDNKIKMEKISKGLIFVGAGFEGVLVKAIEQIDLSETFDKFKENIHIHINAIYEDYGQFIQEDEFLIIEREMKKAFKFKIKEIKDSDGINGVYELESDGNNWFIGCYEDCLSLGSVKETLFSFRDLSYTEINGPFNNSCNHLLSLLSKDYLDSVGHPSIHGSNIWVVSKEKNKRIFTFPKDYKYEVKEDD